MIVRINGVELADRTPVILEELEECVRDNYTKKDIKKLRKTLIWVWSIAGTMLTKSTALAASNNLWVEMQPIFGLFQEIGMVLGAFSIIGGLIIMLFKKRMAIRIIGTAAIVVGGVFLVPSGILLLAIIGNSMNEALTNVFNHMNIGGSVKAK